MKKKTAVHDLRIGMYVSELDRPWRGTPFLFQGFEIRTDEDLAQLRALCEHVYIDSESSHSAATPTRPRHPLPNARRVDSAPERRPVPTFEVLNRFQPGEHHTPRYADQQSLEQELPRARELVGTTRELVVEIMEDARLGHAFDSARARQAVAGMVESVIRNPDALVWLNELKNRDEYTALHSLRVCTLALAFGRHLDFTAEELNLLGTGALLHDIGKLRVPVDILNKPGRLSAEEFDEMKNHVPLGVALLESTPGIPAAAIEVARGHHERYDGHGYIRGLQGDAIGLFGAIGAIVDTYDAITSDRVYHDAISAYDALSELYAARRRDFHPELVEQFIQCMGIYPIGSIVELNDGAVAVVITVNRQRRLKPRLAMVLGPDKKPYRAPHIMDLMHPEAGVSDIRRVLPSGSFGINPTAFMPMAS